MILSKPLNLSVFLTDAAPSVGFGEFFNGEWFANVWLYEIQSLVNSRSTALFEHYPIVVACSLWGYLWTKKRITVFCDNAATVEIINKGRSKIPSIDGLILNGLKKARPSGNDKRMPLTISLVHK